MFARRLPLLWTFAGGSLSGAALIGFWPRAAETTPSPTQQRSARTSEAISPAIATTTPVRERTIPDEAPDTHTEPGSSVADVLVRLEAAYRQGFPAAAPEHAASTADGELTTTTHAEAPPIEVPARAEPAVALAATAPPPTNPPEVIAHRAAAPEAARGPVIAVRDDTQPRNVNVHVGDNTQSTHIGDVFQGDVVVVQQVPVVQYLPFLGAPPYVSVARPSAPAYGAFPGYGTRGVTSRPDRTFASSWTVPSDRLGYDSALVPRLK